jgi:hypothetical protein
MRSLDQRNSSGAWKEVVVEDGRATPAELAASRIDLDDWFEQLSRLKRGIAETLGTGESAINTARTFGVSPGRVSQIRSELRKSWSRFQGEELTCT